MISISTHESTALLAEKLRGFGAKMLARLVGTSPDTTKKWLNASNAPTWKHTVIMLNDPELCPRVLDAAGREDLARSAETISSLLAALAQLKDSADDNQRQLNELIYRRNELAGGGEGDRGGDRGPTARQRPAGDRQGGDREVPDTTTAVRPAGR